MPVAIKIKRVGAAVYRDEPFLGIEIRISVEVDLKTPNAAFKGMPRELAKEPKEFLRDVEEEAGSGSLNRKGGVPGLKLGSASLSADGENQLIEVYLKTGLGRSDGPANINAETNDAAIQH